MGVLSTAARKIRSASAMSGFEIALIIPVFVLLALARLAIIFLPFQSYALKMGRQIGLQAQRQILSPPQALRARRIGRVVRVCARVTPWASLCLAQAMVAAFLLRLAKIPYHVHFGLKPDSDASAPDPLAAHAWLRTDETNLTGGQRTAMYTVVMIFEYTTKAKR